MILNKLELTNFKSHEHTIIEFNRGISLILGENGAGKSTILEAISYALFKDTTGKINDLIRKSPKTTDVIGNMLVTLYFEHNGTHYKIKRGKEKSKSIAELRFKENEKYIVKSKGDRNVNQEIQNLIEMDSKSFLNAVYIRQGEITDLVEKTAAERKEFISKLLNLDALEKSWEDMKTLIDTYKELQQENIGKLSEYDNLVQDKEDMTKKIENTEKTIISLKSEQEKVEQELEQSKLNMEQSDLKKKEHDTLNNTLKQNKTTLELITQRKEKLDAEIKDIISDEEEVKKIEKEIKPLPKLKEITEIKQEQTQLTQQLKQINETMKSITDTKNNIQNTKEDHDTYLKLKETLVQLEEKKTKLSEEKTINELKKQELENKEKEKEHITNESKIQQEYIQKILKKDNLNDLEEIEKLIQSEKEKNKTFKEILEKKIMTNEKEISSLESTIKTIKKSLKNLENTKDKCPICQSEISHSKHEQLSQKYENEIINAETRIEELMEANKKQYKSLEEVKESEESIDKIDISSLKNKNEEYIKLYREVKQITKYLENRSNIEQDYQDNQSQINSTKEEMNTLETNYQNHIHYNKTYAILPEIEDIITTKEEYETAITEKTNKIKEIMTTVRVKDDILRTIKHLEKQEQRYHTLLGKIQNKEQLLREQEDTIKQIAQEEITIQDTSSKINELAYNIEEHEKIHDTYKSCDKKFNEIKTNLAVEESNLSSAKERLTEKTDKIKELNQIKKEQDHITEYIKLLTKIREVYSKDGAQKDLRNAIKPQIEKNTMELFSEFDFPYPEIKLDEDYSITVKNGNSSLSLNMISGGERIALALSLRLGIAKVITKNKTELLILDEPTIHLDEERRKELVDIIGKINFVPQMLVVTHDNEMEPLANNIIKINKENGISSSEEI
ncbi:AAA family ATPase [Methanosphaera sp.]